MEVNKKLRLIGLAKRLEGKDFPEGVVFSSLLQEIAALEGQIPDSIDLSPIKKSLDDIRNQSASLSASLAAFGVELANIKSTLNSEDAKIGQVSDDTLIAFGETDKKIAELRKDLLSKLSSRGGGQANRNIQIAGVNILSPYTDINFKAGTNVTLTSAANLTTRYTDITITASGGGGSYETPSGAVDSLNTTFTPTSEPKCVISDGTTYFDGAGYTWSAPNIIMSIAPSSYIRDVI